MLLAAEEHKHRALNQALSVSDIEDALRFAKYKTLKDFAQAALNQSQACMANLSIQQKKDLANDYIGFLVRTELATPDNFARLMENSKQFEKPVSQKTFRNWATGERGPSKGLMPSALRAVRHVAESLAAEIEQELGGLPPPEDSAETPSPAV